MSIDLTRAIFDLAASASDGARPKLREFIRLARLAGYVARRGGYIYASAEGGASIARGWRGLAWKVAAGSHDAKRLVAALEALEAAKPPVHAMSDDLLDVCGMARKDETLRLTPVPEQVTCGACRDMQGRAQVREPETTPEALEAGDVVQIDRRGPLLEIKKIDRLFYLSRAPREAWVVPCDPHGAQPASWIPSHRLFKVAPVASIETLPIGKDHGSGMETLAEVPVAVRGTGWIPSLGDLRQIATVKGGASGRTYVLLLPWEGGRENVATVLEIGTPILVDRRAYRVTWGGEGFQEPRLEPVHGFSDAAAR